MKSGSRFNKIRGMTKRVLLWYVTVFVMTFAAPILAQDEEEKGLGFTFEIDFATKYLDHGADVYDDEAAFFPAISFDLFGTGFSICIDGAFSFSNTDEQEESDEVNYSICYERSLFEEKNYAMDVAVSWGYMTTPAVPYEEGGTSQLEFSVEWPELIPLGPSHLVPSYTVTWCRSMHGGADDVVFQQVGLGYELPIPAFIPGNDQQVLSMGVEAEHWSTNDDEIDDGWAHATFAFGLPFECRGVEIEPYLAYQISTEDTINDENELYGGIAASVSF